MKSILTLQLLPLAGALIVFLLPRKRFELAGIAAFLVAAAEFALALKFMPFGPELKLPTGFGVTLAFAFDNLSAITMLVLSGATAIAILYSLYMKQYPERTPSFYSMILLVLFGTTGVALARDLIQFYVFWEAMLIPAWLLVVNWNEDMSRARYTGMKFFIITHLGAVLMLASILWIMTITGTTNMAELSGALAALPAETVTIMAILFLAGFIVKLAIFPFNTWLPDAYTTSVMPVTLILVGVMTNIGIYGVARFLPFFPPQATSALSYPLMVAAVVTMFYGGILALVEKNAKKVVAYSSMSQMGYVLFGFATLLPMGMAGSVFNIINQAATKLTLFMCLGIVFEHAGTQQMNELGGWAKRLPFAAIFSTVSVLSLVGAPPLLGFWPEVLTFSAAFAYGNYTLAVLGLVATVISAAYGLRLVRMVFFGPMQARHDGSVFTMRWTSYSAITLSMISLLVMGVYPSIAFNAVRKAIATLGFFLAG